MTTSRRGFIRGFGVALVSLLSTQCINLPGVSPVAPGTISGPARERLRHCWLAFDWFKARARDNDERGSRARSSLLAAHQSALDELVADGGLVQPVADEVQAAYEEAIDYLDPGPGNPGVTCYTVTPTQMVYMQSQSQLLKQAEFLTQLLLKE
ncbi:MAG: hypothetical protein JXA89_00320 [Anaerolineae bacterium]|nr:hypothetical protein [Anaerolineae bacterium]